MRSWLVATLAFAARGPRVVILLAALGACGQDTAPPASDADAGLADAAPPPDGNPDAREADGAPGASRCVVDPERVSCTHRTTTFSAGGYLRTVHHEVPAGEAPAGGWPVAVLFQGSFLPIEFTATRDESHGRYYQTLLVARLLESGFAVVVPETRGGGTTYWDTNVWPWRDAWESAPDHALMVALLARIEGGELGPLDATRLHAAGISSGGYMTSRMALAYPGRFRALAIVAASYATCAGTSCTVTRPLPTDHPPTLFLHGDADTVVPVATMWPYHDALVEEGHQAAATVVADLGHAWPAEAPPAIVGWFAPGP